MCYHVIYPVVSMVSEPEKEHAFPMAMEYHLYLRILMRGGLGVLLCLDIPGFYDLDRIDVRRSNVLVTFLAGAIFFHEKNLKNKAIDLFLVLLGMIFLYLGTK